MKSSLIIPAFNEEKGIGPVIEESLGKVDEILVVDDGSQDGTYRAAKGYDVKVLRHDRNLGKVAAVRTGIREATGDVVILIDADYTYPASYIPLFVERIEAGADLVLGSRAKGLRESMPLVNRIGNQVLSALVSYVSCVKVTDTQTGFRAFRKELFPTLDVDATGLEYETKMTVKAAKLGYNIVEFPIEYRKRIGSSKLHPLKDGYKMFHSILTIALEETSLISKTIIIPSLLPFATGLYFGAVAVSEKIRLGTIIHPYYPLLSAFLILFALQLLSMGLVIDYLTKKLGIIEGKLSKRP